MTNQHVGMSLNRVLVRSYDVEADETDPFGAPVTSTVTVSVRARRLSFDVRDQLKIGGASVFDIEDIAFNVRPATPPWAVGDRIEDQGVSLEVRGVSRAREDGRLLSILCRRVG